jgi:hypothetical protein
LWGSKIFSDRLGTRSVETATTRGKIMDLKIYKCAESDGKCFKCGKFCMECGCWMQGIITYEEYLKSKNQPERSKREDSTFLCNIQVKVDIPPDTKKWHEMMGCGALNSEETH